MGREKILKEKPGGQECCKKHDIFPSLSEIKRPRLKEVKKCAKLTQVIEHRVETGFSLSLFGASFSMHNYFFKLPRSLCGHDLKISDLHNCNFGLKFLYRSLPTVSTLAILRVTLQGASTPGRDSAMEVRGSVIRCLP